MKILADIKRRMTIGTKMTLIDSSMKNHRYLNLPRKIDLVQSNAVRFSGGSYLQYPKANEVSIIDDNTFRIEWTEEISKKPVTEFLTYHFD